MRLLKPYYSAFAVVFSSLIAFSGMCLDAAAASVSVPPATLASWLGEEIHAQYLTNTYTYKATTLHIVDGDLIYNNLLQNPSNNTWSQIRAEWTSATSLVGRYVVWYYFDIPADLALTNSDFTTPQLICDWNVYFSDVVSASWWTCSAVSPAMINAEKYTVQKSYNYTEFGENPNSSASYCYMPSQPSPSQNKPAWYSCSPFSDVLVSGGDISPETNFAYCGAASYSGLYAFNSRYYVGVVCPIFNDDVYYMGHIRDYGNISVPGNPNSTGSVSGSISTDGNGSQSVNVTVETDNTGLVGSILSGIKNLFVPSDDQLQTFSDDMDSLLHDHLGGLYEAVDLIEEQYDSFGSVTAKTELYVPPTTVHLLGTDTFSLGDWHIPLKVSDSRFDFVYTSLAFIIDFLVTVAFVNMCRRKLEIFLNPESEVITDDS